MILLFLAQVVTGGLGLQKNGSPMGYYSPLEDWSEESSEEDDVREFEDEFTSSENFPMDFDSMSQSVETYFISFCFNEHTLEIIPPPPQV